MNLNFNIWSVIILLGAGQGFFLSIYLFFKTRDSASKWLSLLLVVVSLHLLEYAVSISGIVLLYPSLVATTYPLLFCMGPFYYFYCDSLLGRSRHSSVRTLVHFTPAFLVLLMLFPFYAKSDSAKIDYLEGLAAKGSVEVPAEQVAFMLVHVLQTVIYVALAYKLIRQKELEVKNFSSDVVLMGKIRWLKTFSFYFTLYLMMYFVLVVILQFASSHQLELDYVMLFITSFSIYAIGYFAIGNSYFFTSAVIREPHQPRVIQQNRIGSWPPDVKERLLSYMDSNKPYLKSDLKISELADSLSIPYYQLSQLINDEFSVNFYDFVNKYRVEEAKKLLLQDTRNFKILAIAYEVGFNSKATFNRVFKKVTDLTPSQFKEKFTAAQH